MPINGSPSTFAINCFLTNDQLVGFAIPSGMYSSATWTLTATVTNAPTIGDPTTIYTNAPATNPASFGNITNGNVNLTINATIAQVNDINNAAGSTLVTDFNFAGAIGTISVTGIVLTLTSSGGCSYALSPASVSIACLASVGNTFAITTTAGCIWSAAPNASWLHTNSAGVGSGTVTYSADTNPNSTSRMGTITAGGQTFTVTQSGGCAGSIANYTLSYKITDGSCNGGCNNVVISLTDSNSNSAPAPSGGQQFNLSVPISYAKFTPSNPVTVPAGATSLSVQFCSLASGSFNVTVTPVGGTLSANPAQSIKVPVCGAITDNYIQSCPITKPLLRDAIRRNILGFAPIDNNTGNSGDEPYGIQWPGNSLLNQKIAETISDINVRTRFHTSVNLTIPVPAYSVAGAQGINLQGQQGCTTANDVNSIRRVVLNNPYPSTVGNSQLLTPISFDEQDRLGELLDNFSPGTPQFFFITGYTLYLLPGSSTGTSISVYAGTALTQFAGDSDFIDQFPADYMPGIIAGATMRVCLAGMDRLNCAVILPIYQQQYETWIEQMTDGFNKQNESFTPSFGMVSGRRPVGRSVPAIIRRSGRW